MKRNMNQNKANIFEFDLSKYVLKNIKQYWTERNAESDISCENG